MRSSEVAGGIACGPPLLLRDEAPAGAVTLLQRLRDGLDGGAPWVAVETDGVRLARDRDFRVGLRHLDAHVNLLVAGSSKRIHLAIHGRDLRRLQRKALDACADLGLVVTLVMRVYPGMNDHELGDVTLLGLEHPAVRATVFHPSPGPSLQPNLPQHGGIGPHHTYPTWTHPTWTHPTWTHPTWTHPTWAPIAADDLIHRLVPQLPGMLHADHFTQINGHRVACLLSDGEDVVPIRLPASAAQHPSWHTAAALRPPPSEALGSRPFPADTGTPGPGGHVFTIVVEDLFHANGTS
jgi:hypothetical protein